MRRIPFLLAFAAILVGGLCLAQTDAASPSQAPPAPQQAGARAAADSADRSSWAPTTSPPSPIRPPVSTSSVTTSLTAS